MVHDDFTRQARTVRIRPEDEPIVLVEPRNNQTLDLILDVARRNPDWDRFMILDHLGGRAEEEEVNWVLVEYNLRNLYV